MRDLQTGVWHWEAPHPDWEPGAEWGERVSAAVELKSGATLGLEELQAWAKTLLAPYKVPRALSVVQTLPRNAMGKVVKPQVARLFE